MKMSPSCLWPRRTMTHPPLKPLSRLHESTILLSGVWWSPPALQKAARRAKCQKGLPRSLVIIDMTTDIPRCINPGPVRLLPTYWQPRKRTLSRTATIRRGGLRCWCRPALLRLLFHQTKSEDGREELLPLGGTSVCLNWAACLMAKRAPMIAYGVS